MTGDQLDLLRNEANAMRVRIVDLEKEVAFLKLHLAMLQEQGRVLAAEEIIATTPRDGFRTGTK